MVHNDTLVSVIIPVYNTPANILSESLDSILTQAFADYEVLCVDDCSNSLDTINTLDQYEKKYNHLRVISLNNNSGAAQARNIGLSEAYGEYVIFLDADDLFSETLLSKLYSQINIEKADICLFEHSSFELKNGKRCILGVTEINLNNFHNDDEMFIVSIAAAGWNRLCKKKYLLDNNILFQSLKSDNDTFFSLMSLLCAKKIAIVKDTSLLLYRANTDFQISNNIDPLNLWSAIQKTKKELVKRHICYFDKAIDVYTVYAGITELRGCKKRENAKKFYNEFRSYLKNTNLIFKDKTINIYASMWVKEEFDSDWFFMLGDYNRQLNFYAEKLLDVLYGKKDIFIWGNGDRGKAFGRWAKEHKIPIVGICDKKEENVSEVNDYNIKIVSCEEVKTKYGYIIASNKNIYNILSSQIKKECILNLENYCPL